MKAQGRKAEMPLEARDRAAIRAIVKALHVKRDRFGRLDATSFEKHDMDTLCMSYGLPHGGYDSIDKACMMLQVIAGDKPVSILDDGTLEGKVKHEAKK